MTWTETLQSAGFPTEVLLLDFETYFDADYHLGKDKKALSTIEYITDPRFEFIGLGIQGFNVPRLGSEPRFCGGSNVPRVVEGLRKYLGKAYQNCTVVSYGPFDPTILARHFEIYPPYTIDILDLTRYFDARMSHKLKDVAPLFGLTAKGDTNQFKGQHWAEMDHEAMKEYCLQDVALETDLFQRLLPIIDNPKFELDLAQHTLNLYLKPTLNLDLPLAEELETKMIAEVDATIDRVKIYWPPDTATEEIRKTLRGRTEFPLMLQRVLGEDILPQKIGKKGMIPALAKNDEACKELLTHTKKKVRDLVQARLDITSWPSHAKRVQSIINQAHCSDNKVRVPLKYYGGHTGRWSGSEGINLQNLGGKGRGTPIHPLIGMVRGCLMAPPNYTLAIVDSAQIEARALAWLTGQDDLTKGFADGEDIYSEFASKLFGERVWKPANDDDSPEAKIAGIRRGFGKDAILGCIAFDTPVLTDNGWKPIQDVSPVDRLWDGIKWVAHRGVIYQGEKQCINVAGIWLTPEHEILTSDGWTTAAELSTNNRKWETDSGNLQLLPLNTDNVAGSSPSNVVALAVASLFQQETIWLPGNLHTVMSVLKKHPGKLRAIEHLLETRIVQDFLTEFVRLLVGAKRDHTKIMASEVLEFGLNGLQTELLFLNTWPHYQDGITQILKSTESTMTETMNLVISDSLPGLKTLETADILYSGSYKRFQCGCMIVSNCGYGMGTNKFYSRCRENDTLRPLFDSGQYDWDFIDRLIKTYRSTYFKIPEFWSTIEKCFRFPVKYPNETTEYKLNDRVMLQFAMQKSTLAMTLPSGRKMFYRHAHLDSKGKIKDHYSAWWGGSITENIIQSLSRDLLGYWLLECEKQGIHIVHHSHDELVACVPEYEAKLRLEQMIAIMSTGPDWAEGLPLAAEGCLSERYRK